MPRRARIPSLVLLGVVGRAHGVRGLVRVVSYTANPADLTAYGPLLSETGRRFILRWQGAGIAAIAELVRGEQCAVTTRNEATRLANMRLLIERERLPPPAAAEFYIADLVGLDAVDHSGAPLGRVVAVHDYGAGASLEITRARSPSLLVPFTHEAVPDIDIAAGRLTIRPPVERDFEELSAA